MTITIYHNPRCSKSRDTLRILEESGVEFAIVEYLQDPPAAETLLDLARQLGVSVAALLRRAESEFKQAADLPALSDDAGLASWLASHPRVLQRPIVTRADGRAVIGRPPENVLELVRQ